MNLYGQIRKLYAEEACPREFDLDLYLHLTGGYVFCTPTAFVMGRPVFRDAPVADIVDPHNTYSGGDCWHIYLGVGNLKEFLEFLPSAERKTGELPWFSWERKNKIRFYKREDVVNHVTSSSIWSHAIFQGGKFAKTSGSCFATGSHHGS